MSDLYIGRLLDGSRELLPLDAVTRAFAFLGQRGTGKTTGAVVLTEEMVRHGGHVAVLDPVGAWWGITHAGSKKGLKGIVIGGEHGDVPLEETGGNLVAELVASHQYRLVVIDTNLLRKGPQTRFMADYCETLFHLNREALHQVFEEADRPAPQMPREKDISAMRLLGAVEDIVKLGRSRGLGASLVTQRPATLNKNVLEVCENLFFFSLKGPNDRKAARAWLEANGDAEALKVVMDSLASLRTGECWFYSPAWMGRLDRLIIRPRETFDSATTPRVGEKVAAVTERAPVDIDQLTKLMAETVQRAAENDPKALRAQIVQLRRQLETAGEEKVKQLERELLIVRDGLGDAKSDVGHLEEEVEGLRGIIQLQHDRMQEASKLLSLQGVEIASVPHRVKAFARERGSSEEERHGASLKPAEPTPERPAGNIMPPPPARPRPPDRTENWEANGDALDGLKKGERRILDVLVSRYPATWLVTQVGTMTAFSSKGGTFNAYERRLRARGLIERDGKVMRASELAVRLLGGSVRPPATMEETRALWEKSLRKGEYEMLMAVARRGVDGLQVSELAETVGMAYRGGTFNAYVRTLKRNALVEERDGVLVAVDVLW